MIGGIIGIVLIMDILKQNRHQSKKLRDSARGQPCLVRIPGACNHNTETTVLAHPNGGGMGTKKSDLFGAFCCSTCHDYIDGRLPSHTYNGLDNNEIIEILHRRGIERTQQYWLDVGLIKLP